MAIAVVPNPIVPDSDVYTHAGNARWYGEDRRGFDARLVVWHTTESPTATVQGALRYDARRDDKVSATTIIGEEGIGADVLEACRPFTQTRWNDESLSAEVIGAAAWSTAQWWTRWRTLDGLVAWTADVCRRHEIPPVWLTAEQVLAGERGVCDHLLCNQAAILEDPSRKGRTGYTHTDIGAGFRALVPELLGRVAALLAPVDEEDDVIKWYVRCTDPTNRPEGLFCLDGAGATFVFASDQAGAVVMLSTPGLVEVTVSPAQYAELVRVARAGEAA